MKITCEYCGTQYDDTLISCPGCGADNNQVKSASNNTTPQTIEELEQWYKDRNLPPYETTRFFIGINYKNPRAFGIYKDGENFVVYKNKDNGQRAVRYEGTDEAFAVNELYLRLKEEILNQKNNNLSQNTGSKSGLKDNGKAERLVNKFAGGAFVMFIVNVFAIIFQTLLASEVENDALFALVTLVSFALLAVFGAVMLLAYVFFWITTIQKLRINHNFGNILTSIIFITVINGFALAGLFGLGCGIYGGTANIGKYRNVPKEGYYIADSTRTDHETLWYRFKGKWYIYADGDWTDGSQPFLDSDDSVYYDKFTTIPKDKYLGTDCKSEIAAMGYPDFFDSAEYKDLNIPFTRGYYKYEDTYYYHLKDSDYGWYYYDDDYEDWVKTDKDDLPPELRHESLAQDFYYTPTWDSETQMTDFETTEDYADQIEYEARKEAESHNSSSSSSDSSYDWSSSDSWDSGSTDWGSDW